MAPPVIGGEGHAVIAGTPDAPGFDRLSGDLAYPFGSLRETWPGAYLAPVANTTIFVSGRTSLWAIGLVAGDKVSSIRMISGTQAAVAPTTQLFGIYDLSGNRILTTADDGATAWAASTSKSLAVAGVNAFPGSSDIRVATSWTVPTTGIYLVGGLIVAGTTPGLMAIASLAAFVTALAFNCFTPAAAGLTALQNTATLGAAGSAFTSVPYASVA